MKKIIFMVALSSFAGSLCGQPTGSPGGKSSPPQGTTPSTIERTPLGTPPDKLGPKKTTGATGKEQPISQPSLQGQQVSFRPIFFEPGILSLRGGGFVGVDHLYNVSTNIPVVVEITKSPNVVTKLTTERIQASVERIFEKEGIVPTVKPSEGPPLPFFQILVMMIPAGEGVSAFCAGRLFEEVQISRVALPVGVYFQAITWEYQNLVFSSKADSEKQVDEAIVDIIQQFISRYRYYKNVQP